MSFLEAMFKDSDWKIDGCSWEQIMYDVLFLPRWTLGETLALRKCPPGTFPKPAGLILRAKPATLPLSHAIHHPAHLGHRLTNYLPLLVS